MFSVSIFDLL